MGAVVDWETLGERKSLGVYKEKKAGKYPPAFNRQTNGERGMAEREEENQNCGPKKWMGMGMREGQWCEIQQRNQEN